MLNCLDIFHIPLEILIYIAIGVIHALTPIVCYDLAGDELFVKAWGLQLFLQGMGSFVGPVTGGTNTNVKCQIVEGKHSGNLLALKTYFHSLYCVVFYVGLFIEYFGQRYWQTFVIFGSFMLLGGFVLAFSQLPWCRPLEKSAEAPQSDSSLSRVGL